MWSPPPRCPRGPVLASFAERRRGLLILLWDRELKNIKLELKQLPQKWGQLCPVLKRSEATAAWVPPWSLPPRRSPERRSVRSSRRKLWNYLGCKFLMTNSHRLCRSCKQWLLSWLWEGQRSPDDHERGRPVWLLWLQMLNSNSEREWWPLGRNAAKLMGSHWTFSSTSLWMAWLKYIFWVIRPSLK